MTMSFRPSDTTHKSIAVDFLRLAATGHVREAYAEHVGPGFRHHNPFFKEDTEALIEGMEETAMREPDKVLDILRAIEDGDFVAVHSRLRRSAEEAGIAVVHIFRFVGDRIVEFWDVAQPVPATSPNANGMF